MLRKGRFSTEGGNVLSIVKGVDSDKNFSERISNSLLKKEKVIESDGAVGMSSGSVYFTLIAGVVIWLSASGVRPLFIHYSDFDCFY